MEPLSIMLKAPTAPQRDDFENIGFDPLFCISCLNLSPASANASLLERGVFVAEYRYGDKVQAAAEAGEPMDILAPATRHTRLDFAPCQVDTYLEDILASAEGGCDTCAMLGAVLTRLGRGRVSLHDPLQAAQITFCRGVALRVTVWRMTAEKESDSDDGFIFPSTGGRRVVENFGEIIESFELYTLPGEATPWRSIGSLMTEDQPERVLASQPGGRARHVPANPNTASCVTWVHKQLQMCLDTHEACRKAAQSESVPMRVIAVGDSTNTTIRLLETHVTTPATAGYLALSHCWGDSVHLTTNKATLAERKAGIAWSSLPPTFQDAVTVTRALGFSYIWIDSLCIIQDDPDDWAEQAATMASIYQGASLVLAATSSADGDGGCLSPRDPYLQVNGTAADGTLFRLFGRRKREHEAFGAKAGGADVENATGGVSCEEYPLFNRAWCFQERLLATRMLHFTAHEMVFDCLEGIGCECGRMDGFKGDALRRSRQMAKLGAPVGSDFVGWPYGTIVGEDLDRFTTWRRLVLQYSAKAIKIPLDRLPALSGVAQAWSGAYNGRYLAGLWMGDAVSSLLWRVNAPNRPGDAEYIAPSWSWASVYRGVNWLELKYNDPEIFIKVDEGRSGCVLDTVDPFGRVRAGWLCVKGRVLRLPVSKIWGSRVSVRRNNDLGGFDIDCVGACEGLAGKEVLGLRVCSQPPYIHDIGLALVPPSREVLKRLPDAVRNHSHVYRRVGIFQFYHTGEWGHDSESEVADIYLV